MTYKTLLVQADSMEALAFAMDDCFMEHSKLTPSMIVDNITLVPEMRTSAMSPTNTVVVFSCIITYHV